MEKKQKEKLKMVLVAQNDLLDGMLREQACIRKCVKDRMWEGLNSHMSCMEAYGVGFMSLDKHREKITSDILVLDDGEISDLVATVRSKLVRSRIENDSLKTYVKTAQDFVMGVIENCVPQARNKVYTRFGKVQRPAVESVVVDTLL